jgi:hypothetical protein
MRFSILLIIIALAPLLAAPPSVHAVSCQIVQFNVDSPSSASPGQTIQVNTTINIACIQSEGGTYYTGRVDLVDQASKNVLSKGTFTIGASPNATAMVPNSATVPQTNGPWDLDVILYIFESGGIVAVSDHHFQVQVSALPFSAGPNYLAVGVLIAAVVIVGLAFMMMRKRKRNA